MTDRQNQHIDRLLSEDPFGMGVAAKLFGGFRNGKRCHPSTVVRWCTKGIRLADGRQIRLEHLRVANRLLTSRAAIIRFLAAQQETLPVPSPRTSSQRQRDNAAAEDELSSLGI